MDGLLDAGASGRDVEHALACSVVGSPETVRAGLARLRRAHRPDELMVTGKIFDHAARLRSFEILAGWPRIWARPWRARALRDGIR